MKVESGNSCRGSICGVGIDFSGKWCYEGQVYWEEEKALFGLHDPKYLWCNLKLSTMTWLAPKLWVKKIKHEEGFCSRFFVRYLIMRTISISQWHFTYLFPHKEKYVFIQRKIYESFRGGRSVCISPIMAKVKNRLAYFTPQKKIGSLVWGFVKTSSYCLNVWRVSLVYVHGYLTFKSSIKFGLPTLPPTQCRRHLKDINGILSTPSYMNGVLEATK